MLDKIAILEAHKVEIMLFNSTYSPYDWHVSLKSSNEGTKLEIKEDGELVSAFTQAFNRWQRITQLSPEILPPMLSPPEKIPETPFVELDDEIPY